jgi:hypothetical protein
VGGISSKWKCVKAEKALIIWREIAGRLKATLPQEEGGRGRRRRVGGASRMCRKVSIGGFDQGM